MIRWYTCLNCGFPYLADSKKPQERCPTCNGSSTDIISEPFVPGQRRKIHVDPPKPDPNWDPMDSSYHCPKSFPEDSTHGRVRHFVVQYDNAKAAKEFYTDVLDWDIVDTRVSNPLHPLLYAATGASYPNWEPLAPSFVNGIISDRKEDKLGSQPSFCVDVDKMQQSIDRVLINGGKLICEPQKVGAIDIALVEDTEENAFYLWHTPKNVEWNYFNKNYYPKVFGRPPKKYPRRSLHGRCRGIAIGYDDADRVRQFYIAVFGWDFYQMPPYFFGHENVVYWAANGPTQATWEGATPGHVTPTFFPRNVSDKSFLWLEVDSCKEAVEATIAFGGKLVSGRLDGKDWDATIGESGGDWSNMAIVDDSQGNRLLFWQCPGSRTWEEPEAAHDMDFEKE